MYFSVSSHWEDITNCSFFLSELYIKQSICTRGFICRVPRGSFLATDARVECPNAQEAAGGEYTLFGPGHRAPSSSINSNPGYKQHSSQDR